MDKLNSLDKVIETVHKLRAPGGCPWDRAQTHKSLRSHLIEEAYEVLEVLDKIDEDDCIKEENIKAALVEELGDLLMQVLIHSELAAEKNVFDIYEVAEKLNQKLIRRHPHVFGDKKNISAEQVIQNWEKIKEKEKNGEKGILDGLPRNLPALIKAHRTIEKVSKVGFQWKNLSGPWDKLTEEINELQIEVKKYEENPSEDQLRRIESEIGDAIFCLCNIAFFLKVKPEEALRTNLDKFKRRFDFVEKSIKDQGKLLSECELDEMDKYWKKAKEVE